MLYKANMHSVKLMGTIYIHIWALSIFGDRIGYVHNNESKKPLWGKCDARLSTLPTEYVISLLLTLSACAHCVQENVDNKKFDTIKMAYLSYPKLTPISF